MALATLVRVPDPVSRAATALWKTPVTACYALLLLIGDLIMAVLPENAQLSIAHATSTNITHLALDPVLVLPASAFVDLGNGWIWPPLTLLLLGGIERRLGASRAIIITFGAHVIASLVSEGVLLMQVAWHFQPRSAVNIIDVGPSYVLLAALAGCLVIGSWKLRAAALVIGLLIVPNLMVDLPDLDMSSVGHFLALVLGAGLAGYLASERSRNKGWGFAPGTLLRDAAGKAADVTRRVGEGTAADPVRV